MTNEISENSGAPASLEHARSIASLFDLPGPLEVSDFPEKGNINQQAYLVNAGPRGNAGEYILQMLNPNVFTRPRIVMDSMISCIQTQRKALAEGVLKSGQEWETIRLIPTRDGKAYLEIEDGAGPQCWRLMTRILNTHSHKSLREFPDTGARHLIAGEAGKGLAIFQALTATMDVSKVGYPLPGYRDTRIYYEQLISVLKGNRSLGEAAVHLPADPVVRESTERYFLVHNEPAEFHLRCGDPLIGRHIALALEQKSYALTLYNGLAGGRLRTTVIHGDTKLENFLFSSDTGRVKALVDLDTIMPHTWLSDWGDMVRSLVNVAGEKEGNPEKIEVDIESFKAMVRGFVSSAHHIPRQEIELMTDAPQIMALELGVRFLTDYLRGDNYFSLRPEDPPDLNKIRAIVQFRLFQKLRRNAGLLKQTIEDSRFEI